MARGPRLADAPLAHPARRKILDHLRLIPGDHLRGIARSLCMSLGGVRHHLRILRRYALVSEHRELLRVRYYANGPPPQLERNAIFSKHWEYRDTRTRVLQVVYARGEMRSSQVSATVGISRQLALYHLGRLADSGRVDRVGGRGRASGFRAPDPEPALALSRSRESGIPGIRSTGSDPSARRRA